MTDKQKPAPKVTVTVQDNTHGSRGPVNSHADLEKNYMDQQRAMMAQKAYFPPGE
jgi:hypothetical protein